MNLLSVFKGLFKKQKGQGLVEYALILILIAVAALVGVSFVGTTLFEFYYSYFSSLF